MPRRLPMHKCTDTDTPQKSHGNNFAAWHGGHRQVLLLMHSPRDNHLTGATQHDSLLFYVVVCNMRESKDRLCLL
jgi:hypothetical protein